MSNLRYTLCPVDSFFFLLIGPMWYVDLRNGHVKFRGHGPQYNIVDVESNKLTIKRRS